MNPPINAVLRSDAASATISASAGLTGTTPPTLRPSGWQFCQCCRVAYADAVLLDSPADEQAFCDSRSSRRRALAALEHTTYSDTALSSGPADA